MSGPIQLLILKPLHVPLHTSHTLSNHQAGKMSYSRLLNSTSTTPLKLFSPRPPKFTSLPNSGKSLGLFT